MDVEPGQIAAVWTRVRLNKRVFVKDLGARWNAVLALLVLSAMMGCQALDATKRPDLPSNSLVVSSPSLDFRTVVVGNSAALTDTILNPTASSVTITQAGVSGAGFHVTGPALPLTIASGQSATLSVTYSPQTGGDVSGTVVISSTAPVPSVTVSLSGAAVAAGQLTVNPSTIGFGKVPVGHSKTQSGTLTNSGGTNLTISQAMVNGSDFQVSSLNLPLTLAPSHSTSFSVTFKPKSTGSANGMISMSFGVSLSTSGGRRRPHATTKTETMTVPVTGTGTMPAQLTVTPASLSFGSVQVGSSQTLSETLTNTGDSSLTISQATVTGAGFSASGFSLPATLAAGQSETFNVMFAPQSGGAASGYLSVTSDASSPAPGVSLSGTGVTAGSLAPSPSSLSFGTVQVGTSQTLQETLTNSGGSSLSISQATVTGSGFSVSGLNLPATLAAGQSATFNVMFAPQSGGAASGKLSVTSDASSAALGVSLSGTGVTAGSLAPSPSSLSFGTVQVGTSQTLSETLTNIGGSSVAISQATVTGSGFSVSGLNLPATLAAGQSATFNVMFAPQSGGAASGYLSVTSNASNSTLRVSLSGAGATAGALSASPSSISFGSLQVGNNSTRSETLTNSGGSSVTISQANITGSGFSITGLNLPLTLIPGQSFTFGTVFAPTSPGSANGSISVISDASNSTLTVSLAGTGTVTGQLSISPATLDFGSVVVGQSKSLTATLSATGSSVTVSSATTSTSEFALSGLSFPSTIAAGQSASFTVTFRPQASGTATASTSFTSDASNSPALESLTGSGTPPPQHSVDLSWSPSTSSVVGYNLYRGTKSGGPYTRINSVLDASTAYTDSTVQGGQTYYYVTTAVNTSGSESGYSNQVRAVIPSP